MIGKMHARTVGHWPLQESAGDALDYSGNERHGTVSGAAYDAPGPLGGSAMSFDAVDDYIDCGTVGFDVSGANGFTASAWVNAPGTDPNNRYVFGSGVDNGFYLRFDNGGVGPEGSLLVKVDDGANHAYFASSGTYDDGNWHFVTLVNEPGGPLRGYADGVEFGQASHSTGDMAQQPFYIGTTYDSGWGGTASSFMNGSVAHVRIWDYPLPAAQIRALADPLNSGGFSVSGWR